jgi:hypothetical protein
MLNVTVSGSFHRFMVEIEQIVQEFTAHGIQVLSPACPKVVDHLGEFLFVASDRVRSVRLVQDRHLASIAESDFLWLVAPDGYVGQSAAMEIGFAVARGIPVLATTLPSDITLQRYVIKVDSINAAVRAKSKRDVHEPGARHSILIDPGGAIEFAHDELQRIETLFAAGPNYISDAVGTKIYQHCASIGQSIQWSVNHVENPACKRAK